MLNRLPIRMVAPVVLVTVLIGVGLYVFVLRAVSDFADFQIRSALNDIASEVYDICDENFTELMQSGKMGEDKAIMIKKAFTVGAIEDFAARNNIACRLQDRHSGEIFNSGIEPELMHLMVEHHAEGRTIKLTPAGRIKYFNHFDFKPWGWHFDLIKEMENYAPLITRVKVAYTVTAALLLAGLILILQLQNRLLQRPLNRIIQSIRSGNPPDYKGVAEFEFLSDNIAAMMQLLEERNRNRLDLESRLQKARKMEAIGTLAGGVAHDLNNILSGLVSYPDLILMDLDKDSPLREPIGTIKQSGERAAVIVQDLLTLARRGVAISEVVNMNAVIADQLKSPEFGELQTLYPQVRIKTCLEPALLNVKGSATHLAKAVMNILSNAAEAMPHGGDILIRTDNRYIDSPIQNDDHVQEGDYITVTISDTGIGIPTADRERIFEPFYTKKVMGRSGTGLGMAVVWGTMKDHHGYIDVNSTEGRGTTFTLYLPVCREALPSRETTVTPDDIQGRGETILVVDDVPTQRELASAMLMKLGYAVTTATSGEEAVAYLADHAVDLLVLDMIMEPGIDGLETYRRIVKQHPGQKAIIASGYSETDRVKQAQRLGAKQYIKKPYTIEKIGLAVKSELKSESCAVPAAADA
jgi:signal transduction histidine kinase/ActR/RegA family two-component response regulator